MKNTIITLFAFIVLTACGSQKAMVSKSLMRHHPVMGNILKF
ncbi:MAG: hypothetical protein ABF274_12685 [Nonlabens sp.]